jgi:hypothetical protein
VALPQNGQHLSDRFRKYVCIAAVVICDINGVGFRCAGTQVNRIAEIGCRNQYGIESRRSRGIGHGFLIERFKCAKAPIIVVLEIALCDQSTVGVEIT